VTKRVVIIASGPTEQAVLPRLLGHLAAEGIAIDLPVVIPPGHHDVRGPLVEKLVLSAWFGRHPRPDKFVVLKDADGKDPREVGDQLREELSRSRIGHLVDAPVVVTIAKWHLEAWFFADVPGLRGYLGRELGNVDPSDPDAIANLKLILKSLLREPYTTAISHEIAERLASSTLGLHSRSFRELEAAVRNGRSAPSRSS
jgi:Domain of unknown function (DUF4276)